MNRAFFSTVRAKNHIYASDHPASECMKFVCAVDVYVSGTVCCTRYTGIGSGKVFHKNTFIEYQEILNFSVYNLWSMF